MQAKGADGGMIRRLAVLAIGAVFGLGPAALAGPPFVTDDPEPVELGHWELYIGSQVQHDPTGYAGTAPQIEANYGAIKNLQLHVIAPLAYDHPSGAQTQFGVGDLEVGLKYRFLNQAPGRPSVGLFPLVEFPTGSSDRGLGSGHVQLFLPVWIQKDWGKWTSYGGGGYFVDGQNGDANYTLLGWEIQRQLSGHLMLGTELFTTVPSSAGAETDLNFNVGGQIDINDQNHLLFSSGRSFKGDLSYMGYIAYQWTFGPK